MVPKFLSVALLPPILGFAEYFRIKTPLWLLTVAVAAISAAPWLRWRFSLRTLLIGMTVAAIGLGWIIYTSENNLSSALHDKLSWRLDLRAVRKTFQFKRPVWGHYSKKHRAEDDDEPICLD